MPRKPGAGRRRGRRGGRGRGRDRRPSPDQPAAIAEPPADAVIEAPTTPTETPVEAPAAEPPVPAPRSPEPPAARNGPAVTQAMEEVAEIVELLKQSLDKMEEVLELVELAERQKLADEREIDSLRRALHRIHQPRGGRHEPREHGE